jgi:hypothetical protein
MHVKLKYEDSLKGDTKEKYFLFVRTYLHLLAKVHIPKHTSEATYIFENFLET